MIFEPYNLRKDFQLRNRLVMAPMTTYSSDEDYHVSAEELAYYKLRSKTIGLVITAATSVNASAQAFPRQITLKDDRYINSLAELAKTIQREGAKAVVQLHHGGRMNDPSLYPNKEAIVSASSVKPPRESMVTPRALTETEVYQTITDFAQATRRAIEAGFDGVELHGANTYLLQQFFSPHSNRRTDYFGGSIEKRMRFITHMIDEVYETIQIHAKKPFILGYRFSPEELEKPGITIEDTLKLIDTLKTKPLDYLHISLGKFDQSSINNKNDKTPLVTKIQSHLNHRIPFIASGDIKTKESLEAAYAAGYDLFASGMALLADPYWGETIRNNPPIMTLDKATLPSHLYQRLYKNRDRFEASGYHFSA